MWHFLVILNSFLCFVLVFWVGSLCLFKFSNYLAEEEGMVAFLQISCVYLCSVSLPYGGVAWPAVVDKLWHSLTLDCLN